MIADGMLQAAKMPEFDGCRLRRSPVELPLPATNSATTAPISASPPEIFMPLSR